jgi:serine protease Do
MRGWRPVAGLALAALVAAGASPAAAQDRVRPRDERLKLAFADLSDRHRFEVGRVLVAGEPRAYGVLVREDRLLTVAEPLRVGPDGSPSGPLTVRFQGESAYPARLVARDERWNLAVVAVEPTELVDPIPLDQGGDARLGRWVVAVGTTPMPMAVGAVSAVGRAVVEATREDVAAGGNPAAALVRGGRRYREVFQYDAMLSPDAHHGMPLFDGTGRFVGLSVETRTRGTSYAVPARRVREALPALLEGRTTEATRPGFIGINAGFLALDEARRLGVAGGVPVATLLDAQGRPLSEGATPIGLGAAGARPGDIIVRVDGQEVVEIQTLQEVVQLFNPGERVTFTVLREGKPVDLQAVIAERPRTIGRR